jgi:hypothetical protein
MKRTSPWVWVAAAAVQLAALGLCLWAMERERDLRVEAEAEPVEETPAPRQALAPAPPLTAADVAFAKDPIVRDRIPEPVVRPVHPLEPRESAQVEPNAGEAVRGPRFGPPPGSVPQYIGEVADASTQIVRGKAGEGAVTFGLYANGNVRCVDADGARYHGRTESARARMREDGGTRAFTVQLSRAPGGGLEATFTGGTHDGETIALEPLVRGSIR